MQLHVHGSFSEGIGSIDSHSYEASKHGLDVLWWSDHDFRIGSFHHAGSFGFEGEREFIHQGEDWTPLTGFEAGYTEGFVASAEHQIAGAQGVYTGENAHEGRRSFRVLASSEARDFEPHLYRYKVMRGLHRRPLSSVVTLHLSVFPEEAGPDARAVVNVDLSEHPPRQGLPFTTYAIQYFLDERGGEPVRDGTVYRVPLRYVRGEWNHYALELTRDARRAFPFAHANDNSLHDLSLGVEARRGATAAVLFDALRIEQEIAGASALQRQRELMSEVGADYPAVTQHQGLEFSFWAHLNAYSLSPELPDYEAIAAASGLSRRGLPVGPEAYQALADFATRKWVVGVHARDGLVSLAHPYGGWPEESRRRVTRIPTLSKLVASRARGADLLEVGYRDRAGHDLASHLWLWDRLGMRGLHLVGVGVSDSHGGPKRFEEQPNNFVSWVFAPSSSRRDLLEGMRAGRVFFGDLTRFDGTLDLRTKEGVRMGQLVLTREDRDDVIVEAEGLESGDEVQVIVNGKISTRFTATGSVLQGSARVAIEPARPTIVRVEIYDTQGEPKAFSNPLTYLREPPLDGIPPARAVAPRGM